MEGMLLNKTAPRPAFSEFGKSDFSTGRKTPLHRILVREDRTEIRRQIRELCPRTPGVYGMIDRDGQLIYVGMSVRLRDRLLTYFTSGPPSAKEQRIAARAHFFVWEEGDHEFTVRLRELELIRRFAPAYNVRGRPGRNEVGYVFVTTGEAPCFRAWGAWRQRAAVPPDLGQVSKARNRCEAIVFASP